MTVENNVIRIYDQPFGNINNTNGMIGIYSFKWIYNTNLNQQADGKIYLDISPDAQPYVWSNINQIQFGLQASLTISIGLAPSITLAITGGIPAGYIARLRTEGTVPLYVKGQEVLF